MLEITVTPLDLEHSINKIPVQGDDDYCYECLIATAIGQGAMVTENVIHIGPRGYKHSEMSRKLMNMFDNSHYTALRSLLPVTLYLEPYDGAY